jgi:hypothetical protein
MSQVVSGPELATTSGDSGTELSTLLAGLSTPQQLALSALAEGKTYTDAAETAGIGRTTLWRWIRADPKFAAAYEAWQQELRESARARLLKATDMAADVVTQAIAGGDARIALRMLQEAGVLGEGLAGRRRQQPKAQTAPAAGEPPSPAAALELRFPSRPLRSDPQILADDADWVPLNLRNLRNL